MELNLDIIETEWRIYAYHEACHAIAYFMLGYPPHDARIGDNDLHLSLNRSNYYCHSPAVRANPYTPRYVPYLRLAAKKS